jgi:hypothetical protein
MTTTLTPTSALIQSGLAFPGVGVCDSPADDWLMAEADRAAGSEPPRTAAAIPIGPGDSRTPLPGPVPVGR